MGQQVSIEAAYEVYRTRASELFHENALLRAQTTDLEARVKALQAELEQARAQPAGQAPLACVEQPDALP
jgi:uncharacterized protein YlxW (UPF0749 family)